MNNRFLITIHIFLLINAFSVYPQQNVRIAEIDVLHYKAEVEPDILKKTIKGHVTITFKVVSVGSKVVLDCGDLQIERIESNGKQTGFETKNSKLTIDPGVLVANQSYEVMIGYHGDTERQHQAQA